METKKGKTYDMKFLSSIIQETSSLRGRIAILTYQNLSHSVLADKVVIFIEHFQSIILFIYTNYSVFKKRNHAVVNVIEIVFSIVSSANFGGYLTADKHGTMGIVIFTLIALLLFVLKMLVFGYIIVVAVRNKTPSRNIHIIWQWIFKFQPRVIYYQMAPILMGALEGSWKGDLDLNKGRNDFLKVLGPVLLICEFSFALILQTQFTCTLPTKNFLSSKNNITEILTLMQKFLGHIIRRMVSLVAHKTVVVWLTNFTTLSFSTVRLFLYFKYLPAYNIDCLFYQMYFLVVTLALNIVSTMEVIFGENRIDMNLVIGLWVILSVLLLRISISYLKNRLAMMVLSDREKSPEGLIHKLIAAKYFLKKGDIIKGESKVYNWITLVKASLLAEPKRAFDMIANKFQEEEVLDMDNKVCKNRVFALYLEELLEKNSESDFIRLYAAYHFATKQRLYGRCLRTIHELKSSTSWNVEVSVSVLLHNIQQKIIHESQNKAFLFNIAEYVQSTSLFAEAKLKVLEQSEHQIRLYQEMKESFPLSTRLYSLGLKVLKAKSGIEKGRRELFQKIPEHYMEPLLFYAHYYLTLNHSYYKFVDYCRLYSQRLQKFNKYFKSEIFCQENFYNKTTAFMIFSGDKKTQGRILYCGGNYEEILGRNLTGYYFGAGLPPILQIDPKLMMNSLLETEEKASLNRLQRRYLYHQSGFMTDVEYFININPFISQGLNYYAVFRRAHKQRECILVNKDGRIEGFTKRIGEELGLFSLLLKNSDVSVEQRLIGRISPQLQLANDAFNYVLDFEKKLNGNMKINSNSTSPAGSKSVRGKGKFSFFPNIMSIEEANEICSVYTEGENQAATVNLEKIIGGEKIAYHCTINHLKNNAFGAKEIYLERVILDFEIGSREIAMDTANQIIEEEIVDEKMPNETEFQAPRHFRKHTSLQRSLTPSPKRQTLKLQQPTSPTQRYLLASQREEEIITGLTEGERFDSMSNILSHNESVFSLKSDHIGRNKLKRQKVFEQAIEIPHRPLRHKLLLLLLGCCLVFIFGLQFNLNVRIQNGFETFALNKDIVLNAESRNYFLGSLNNFLGLYYTEALGLATVQDFYPDETAKSFNQEFFDQIFSVRALESSLMEMANSLSETQADIFFEKDIRIFDSFEENGDYSRAYYLGNFSNFQATNQVIEASLKAATLVMGNMPEAMAYLQFGIRNILNDILIKAMVIAESFYDSLQRSKEDFLSSLAVTFYIVIFVPGLGLIASYFLILKQYKIDKANMLAFSKINQHAVESALNNSAGFKSFLQQNSNFEDLYKDEKALGLLKKDIEYKKVLKNQFAENSSSSSLNSNGFARAYILQGLNVLVMFLLVFVSFAVYFFKFQANLNSLGEKAHQIYFLERVTSKVILIRACYFELVYLNNTIPIQNDVPMTVLLQQVSDLQDAQHELQVLFSSKNAQENSLVQDMLFGDACKYLDVKNFGLSETDGDSSDLAYKACRQIGHYQNQASWINLIGNIKQYFQDYLSKYEHSNKTAEALGSLAVDYWHNLHYPTFLVSYGVSDLLYAAIDREFEEISERSKAFNNNMIALFLFVVILVGVLGLWGFIFPLMSRENKFKQFLLLFPANAISSNFMLKSFLMKISIGTTFDSIMQEL